MANQYLYDLTDTWNNVATTFDAIKINVTDTNSATASKLIDLQVGGVSKFKVQKDGDVTADRLTVTKTTANAPAISSTGYSLTGSNAQSLVDLAGTWNTSGTPTAIKLNITESSTPNANSLLLDLQRGSASYFSVSRSGIVATQTAAAGGFIAGNGQSTGAAIGYWNSFGGVHLGNGAGLFWGTGGPNSQALDLSLFKDAAGTLAQRNGTNTQAFRVYRTWADSGTNYEALELAHATVTISSVSKQYSILRTITAGSGADDINLVLSPSGTGALVARVPDGTATGGSARGAWAVDWQMKPTGASAANVASAEGSTIVGGWQNTSSGEYSVTGGYKNTASAYGSTAFGDSHTVSGSRAAAVCYANTASGSYSFAIGFQALANKLSQFSQACGQFGAVGDAQRSAVVMRRATADANATELFLDGSSTRLTIPSNTAWHADVRIIGRQVGGANHAIYHRKCCIERTVNATALVSTVQTIGTDIETDANWDVAITADDTNDALKIEVTGVAATNIRWVAEVQLVEVAYA